MIKAEELTQEKYYRNLIVFYVHEENPRIRVGYFSDPKTERVFIDAKTKEEFSFKDVLDWCTAPEDYTLFIKCYLNHLMKT